MGIESICNTITQFFSNTRTPAKKLSKLLMLCSLFKRPGLSTIYSVANITKTLNQMGIPTGPNPDGTPNLTVATVYAVVDEIYRAMKEDASVQGALMPGTSVIPGGGTIANTETEIVSAIQ